MQTAETLGTVHTHTHTHTRVFLPKEIKMHKQNRVK